MSEHTTTSPDAEQLASEQLAAEDGAARRLAKREYEAPLALEAGAGTGKTATLVARVVCWVLGRGWALAREELRATGEPCDDDAVAARALEGVVAITFTEAAAAEMAERCARAFADVARGALPIALREEDGDWEHLGREGAPDGVALARADVARRAAALLDAQDHLATRTIHAFCRAVLARHPLEARLAPGFEVDADGSRAEALAREVLEAHLRDAWREPVDEAVVALLALGKGPPELEAALLALHRAGARADDLAEDPFTPARIAALDAETRRRVRAVTTGGLDPLATGKLRGTKSPRAIEALRATQRALSAPIPADADELATWLAELLAPWEEDCLERLRDWGVIDRKRDPKGDFEALGEHAPGFAAASGALHVWLKHLGRLDVPLLANARAVLGGLLAALEARLARAGVASFETLLSATEQLLAAHPGIAAEERRRIRLLLVDEFQDTDATQCAIVRALALDGPADERPSLFLVGDPKQSIYGWRRADLAAYEAFLGEVDAAGGRRLPLAVNFRSVPAVLEEVRRLVEPVMVRTEGLQPAFQPLLPRPDAADDPSALGADRRHVEHWVSWVLDPRSGKPRKQRLVAETYALEARALAADLAALHAEGLAWRDAAVLVRSSTALDAYLEAFRARRIPYEVRGDKNYYRRREVVDAIALVRAVLDPSDHLALVALLRSPWVGVPDAIVARLFAAGGQALLEALGTGPADGDVERLERLTELAARLAAEVLDVPGLDAVARHDLALVEGARAIVAARRAYAGGSAVQFVETLRRVFLPEPLSAERFQGEWRLPNLARFFRELTLALDDCDGDAHAVLRRLRTDLEGRRDAEEARPLEATRDAVQIMTIHRSKGLDFEHVYLPQLHKAGQVGRAPSFAFERRDGRAAYALFGAPTLEFVEVEERARRTEAAERVRLFYVATTRAKRRLVLLSEWPTSEDHASWEDAATFADLLPHRAGGLSSLLELRALLDAHESDAGSRERHSVHEDATGAAWRLVGRLVAEDPSADAGAPEEAAPPPDLEPLLALASELGRARFAAAARASRPFSARASEAAHAALADVRAEADEDNAAAGARPPVDPTLARTAALAAGTAVHVALERLPLGTAPAEAPAEVRRLALAELDALADAPERDAARDRVETTCDALAGGRLLARLLGDEVEVLARELPLLVGPADGADDGPIGFVAGSVDLLLRDRATGELVVVDHKSDEVASEGVAALAAAYAPQLRAYGRAVQQALGLPEAPRLEAWFLALDQAQPLAP